MNTPRHAAAAAKMIRRHLPIEGAASGDRARGIATIERAMHVRARRRRLLILGSVVATAAAVVVAIQIAKWRQPGRVTEASAVAIEAAPSGQGAALARPAGEEPLTAPVAIESGQRIDTPQDGGAALRFSTGTSMTLAGHTSFRVDSQGATQRFSLQQGELLAHVAKLKATQRFIVDTPDAEVEVRGTRFRLRVVDRAESCGGGTRTRLDVTEGAVEVRLANAGVISVKAGEVWPADCADEREATAGVVPSAVPTQDALGPKRGRRAGPVPQTESERASSLLALNDLFAEGVARSRQGDTSGALRIYEDLLTRYPSSPLAENAMVERMRLLANTGAGVAEARRYLGRYPRGFAVAEASKLVAVP